jgi:hypothetical protein
VGYRALIIADSAADAALVFENLIGKGNGMKENNTDKQKGNINVFNSSSRVLDVNGCKVTLNFLPKSNGETIDTVKKILSPQYQYQDIVSKADKAG